MTRELTNAEVTPDLGLLGYASLDIDEETVTLIAQKARADLLLGDQTRRRAETLAAALGRRLVVRST